MLEERRPHRRSRRNGARGMPFLLGAVCVLGIALASVAAAGELPAIVATVEDQPISSKELTESLQSELMRLESERYRVLKGGLDELIAKRLRRLEADSRQISEDQLLRDEITSKLKPISNEEAKSFYEANKDRIRQPYEQIAPRIVSYLQQQERESRERAFYKSLKQRYKVRIAIKAPTVDVSSDDDPFMGPADAVVTIIEFSDFQCPYCRRVQPALKQLLKDYEGKVKLVFRDFPLRSIHPQAQKASEAAECAADQDKFWPYHDKLFAVTALSVKDLKQYAKELELDTELFNTCLDSGQHAAEVEADLKAGQRAGVSATPSFFVNGQSLSGAVPYERFQELIDAALEQSQSAKR